MTTLEDEVTHARDDRRRAALLAVEAMRTLGAVVPGGTLLDALAAGDVLAAEALTDARAEAEACGERLMRRALTARVEMLAGAAAQWRRAVTYLIETRAT